MPPEEELEEEPSRRCRSQGEERGRRASGSFRRPTEREGVTNALAAPVRLVGIGFAPGDRYQVPEHSMTPDRRFPGHSCRMAHHERMTGFRLERSRKRPIGAFDERTDRGRPTRLRRQDLQKPGYSLRH